MNYVGRLALTDRTIGIVGPSGESLESAESPLLFFY
jgi:hypothetical protein